MRILLFNFMEVGSLGGVDVILSILAERFTACGHAASIVELTKSGSATRTLPSGVQVLGVPGPSYPAFSRPRSWFSFARSTVQFMKVVRAFKPDIVHVHYPTTQSLPVVGAYTFPHKWRLVVTVHNSDIRVAPLREPQVCPWQDRLLARADAITAVNQALLDDAIAAFPVIGKKGRVVLNGVGKEWFQPLAERSNSNGHPPYILFAGRLSYVKGVDVLLKAWSGVTRHSPQTRLLLAGEGPEQNALESLAGELRIKDSVTFLGRKSQGDLRELYRNSAAVVLPSRREGLPFSLLEAAATGAICVGTRTAGIPDIIQDGQTGYLVDTESPEQLEAALNRALDLAPPERTRMKHRAQDSIRARFSEERMIASYLELFASLVGHPGRQ